MSPFEFTITLISIVIALGIARILGGYADLIQHRKETEHSWLFLIWFSFLLLTHVGWWFSLWGSSRDEIFSLSQFIILLSVPCFLFIATRLLIPSEGEFHKNRETLPDSPGALSSGVFSRFSAWSNAAGIQYR